MDSRFEAILNSLPNKKPRSRLEPYCELILEMRKRGQSYRAIAQILRKSCGLKFGSSTVNDFVLAHSKSQQITTGKNKYRSPVATSSYNALQGVISHSKDTTESKGAARSPKVLEGIARTLKELKDRPLKTHTKKVLFEYNPDEPLRLQHDKKLKKE